MYLHRDRETFKDMVEQAADSSGMRPVTCLQNNVNGKGRYSF